MQIRNTTLYVSVTKRHGEDFTSCFFDLFGIARSILMGSGKKDVEMWKLQVTQAQEKK